MDNGELELKLQNPELELSKEDFPSFDFHTRQLEEYFQTLLLENFGLQGDEISPQTYGKFLKYGKTNISSEPIPFLFQELDNKYLSFIINPLDKDQKYIEIFDSIGYRIIPCNTKLLTSLLDQMIEGNLKPEHNVGIEKFGPNDFRYFEELIIPSPNNEENLMIRYDEKGRIIYANLYSEGINGSRKVISILYENQSEKRIVLRDKVDFYNRINSLHRETKKEIEKNRKNKNIKKIKRNISDY